MATLDLTAKIPEAEDFLTKIRDAADGPGDAPYVDGRVLAAFLSMNPQLVQGVILPATTVADDGTVIAATDDVVIDCGFVPRLVVVQDSAGAIYLNMQGQLDTDTLKVELAATTLVDVIEFMTGADNKKFTLKAAGLSGNVTHTYFAIG